MEIGFNGENIKKETHVYEDYYKVGQAGHYAVGQISVMGILKEINFKEKYILVQPSIVGYGNNIRLETGIPTVMGII